MSTVFCPTCSKAGTGPSPPHFREPGQRCPLAVEEANARIAVLHAQAYPAAPRAAHNPCEGMLSLGRHEALEALLLAREALLAHDDWCGHRVGAPGSPLRSRALSAIASMVDVR